MLLGYYLTFNRGMGPEGMWTGMIAGLAAGAALMSSRFFRRSAELVREGTDGLDDGPPPVF